MTTDATTHSIANSMGEQIVDLNRVIETLTDERDRLIEAVDKLDGAYATLPKRRAKRSVKRERSHRGSQKARILKLTEKGKSAQDIAKQLHTHINYVYLVQRKARQS